MTDARMIARRIVLDTLVEIARDETRPLHVRQAAYAEAAERFRPLFAQVVDAIRPVWDAYVEAARRVTDAFAPLVRRLTEGHALDVPEEVDA